MTEDIVKVNNYYQLEKVIVEFSKGDSTNKVETTIKQDGKSYKLEAPVSCDYKSMLIDGFNIIKKRQDAINKALRRGIDLKDIPVDNNSHMWVDDIIERRMGGVRDGLRVRWDLSDGTYFFDPFTSKLTKIKR